MLSQTNALQVCLYTVVDRIDSLTFKGWPDYAVNSAVCGRLVNPPSDDSAALFEPMLLAELRPNETFTQWTLQLKPSLRFHDGRIATSEDLVFSITRHLTSPVITPNRMELMDIRGAGKGSEPITGVKCIDSLTVEISLDRPNPRFFRAFFDPRLSLVCRDHVTDDLFSWRQLPIGAGPMKALSATQNGGLLLQSVQKGKMVHLFPSIDPVRISQSDILLFCPDARKPVGFDTVTLQGCVSSVWGVFFNFDSDQVQDKEIRHEIRRIVYSKQVEAPAGYTLNRTILPKSIADQLGIKSDISDLHRDSNILSGKTLKVLNWHGSQWCADIVEQMRAHDIKVIPVEEKSKCDIRFWGFVPHPYTTYEVFGFFQEGGTWVSRLKHPDRDLGVLLGKATSCSSDQALLQLTRDVQHHFESGCYVIPIMESPASWHFKKGAISPEAIARFGFYLHFDQLL